MMSAKILSPFVGEINKEVAKKMGCLALLPHEVHGLSEHILNKYDWDSLPRGKHLAVIRSELEGTFKMGTRA